MIRLISAASIVTVAVAFAPVAFAKDIKETKTFTKANGTKVVAKTSFHTKTDVTDIDVTKTKTDGKVRTVNERISPDKEGGFTVHKTVTGFNDKTHTSTGHIGAGHSAASAGSGGHGSSKSKG